MPAFLSLENLRPFFDLSDKHLLQRLKWSLVPFSQQFFNDYNEKPDLYGPFWVLATLICSMYTSSNLYCYLTFDDKEEAFNTTTNKIPVAAAIVFGVAIGLPSLMRLVLNLYGTQQSDQQRQTSLVKSVGIYCYSFCPLIVASCLCGVLPYQLVHWLIILVAGAQQVAVLFTSFWADFQQNLPPQTRWIAIGVMAAIQLVLLLVFKLYFYPLP